MVALRDLQKLSIDLVTKAHDARLHTEQERDDQFEIWRQEREVYLNEIKQLKAKVEDLKKEKSS